MVVYVGADWDRSKCVVCAQWNGERQRGSIVRHPEAVRGWMEQFAGSAVVVGIEAGDPLWVKLWQHAGADVHVFDARKAKRYAQSLSSSGASDDRRSAESLLSQVQSEAHRREANGCMPDELRGLQRFVDVHDTIRGELNRHANRLDAILRQVHPALRDVLGELAQVSVVRLLRAAPTPTAWTELSPEDRQAALKGVHKARRAQILAAMGEDWARLSPNEEAAARFQVRQSVAALELFVEQRAQTKVLLTKAIEEDPLAKGVSGIHGLGPLLSAGTRLALETKEGHRDRMARRTGVAPVTQRSGTRGDLCPKATMRRSAPHQMRNIGYLLAVQLVARHAWAKAQFGHYKARGIDSSGAYRRVGRSFTRVLAALVRDGAVFDPDRYVAALKKAGVPWAAGL